MISVLLNSAKNDELTYMRKYSQMIAAKLSDDQWSYFAESNQKKIIDFLLRCPLLDIACVDVTSSGGIDNAVTVRSMDENTLILLIADEKMSPMSYMRPDIMAASLLLRPFTSKQLQTSLLQIFKYYLDKNSEEKGLNKSFVVENRDGRRLIPFNRIIYFESREKKVFAVTESAEYSFYDTLDNLENELPANFERCHRSFVVNTSKIERITLSQSLIFLQTGDEIPLSRSYKPIFKKFK